MTVVPCDGAGDVQDDEMRSWYVLALVVFAVTFVAHLAVTALWPGSDVDWAATSVVAGSTAVVLTVVLRRGGRS